MDASCPAISVVIPSYNYGHLLPRALDSVLHQLGENDALIVIDDGSTDDTAQCLAEYAARHPGLSAVRQENAGAAAARNHGIRLAPAGTGLRPWRRSREEQPARQAISAPGRTRWTDRQRTERSMMNTPGQMMISPKTTRDH